MTRTPDNGGATRSLIFKLRVTAAEKTRLLMLAKEVGLTPSDFARTRLIGSKPLTHKATPERENLIRLQAELNRVGNNANQIARALNRRSDSDNLTGIDPALITDVLQGIKLLTAYIAEELEYGHSRQ